MIENKETESDDSNETNGGNSTQFSQTYNSQSNPKKVNPIKSRSLWNDSER